MKVIKIATIYLLILLSKSLKSNITIFDKLYEITAFNDHERSVLYNLLTTNETVMFLNSVTNEAAIPMQVIVHKCCVTNLEQKLQHEGIEYIANDDFLSIYQRMSSKPWDITDGFIKWENISMWIEKYQKLSPLLNKIIISYTYERRELFILSIKKRKENPAVVIVGGEQGKDWISAAIILNIISRFISNHYAFSILDYYTFYFLPVFNPDGYVHSMTKDRFWDKNRKAFFPKKKCRYRNGINDFAVGVNIDRNWYFGEQLGVEDGTECSSVYLGHKPLSEEEPKALANFINAHASNIMAFFNIKGFGGRFITLPYSDITMHSNNHGVVKEMILSACESVHLTYNSTYHHGHTAQLFYNLTGNSADWVKKNFNIPVVATIHMKYKDELFPQASHVEPLSDELIAIINDTLIKSKEIYGPLFNNGIYSSKNCVFLSVKVAIIIVGYLICNKDSQ